MRRFIILIEYRKVAEKRLKLYFRNTKMISRSAFVCGVHYRPEHANQ